jgi:hypothetical protein
LAKDGLYSEKFGRPPMRLVPSAQAPILALLLAGCNATRAPLVELPPPTTPTTIRVTPPESHALQGCAGDITRFRAIQDNDLAMGHVEKGVYTQIQGELAEADQACTAGDNLRAEGLLRATKARHGYPTG